MSEHERFAQTLQELIDGERPVKNDFNDFVGHCDVLRQLLEVAPDEVRAPLQQLHDLMAEARDATGAAVLGIFPKLIDPELANVYGQISDYIRTHCGIALGDPTYVKGELVRESNCGGWPGAGSPLTSNRFPYLLDTSASNYFSNRFWHGENAPPGFIAVPKCGRVVFRGEFPYSRYFAFHPSDFDTNNLRTIIDVDIEPDEGSANPFRGPVAEGQGRRFTTQLIFTPAPDDPEPNTTYVGLTKKGEPNQAVFNIYRTTGSVLGALPPNNTGVLLPSVTVYNAAGEEVRHFGECEPYPPGTEPPVDRTHFAPLAIPDARGLNWPEQYEVKANWGLPYDILASDDILYLVTPYTRRLGEVHVTRGKKPAVPRTPEEPVYAPDMQLRGFTVTTYNFWAGICEGAVIDKDIAVDDDGHYTLVVSHERDRPANATPENGVTWIDWGDYLDGQLTFRILLKRDPLVQAIGAAIESGEASPDVEPYVPRSRHCSKAAFEAQGWRAAFGEA